MTVIQNIYDVSEQKTAVSCHIARCCCQGAALYGCECGVCGLGAGLEEVQWGVGRVIVLVSGLAEGQEPLVRLQWVRRLTEPQQSQDAAWDIDRLEPEGSCRIGTHCQRLGYHHRLPASQGGRGYKMERESEISSSKMARKRGSWEGQDTGVI